MKLYSLKIKDSVFKVSVISDEKDMVEGLSGKPKLGEGKGLFFKFEEPQEVTMNMGGMLHPIDMIFIGKDFKVIGVEKMNIGSSPITVDKVHYVIEVNKGEGKDLKGEKMQMSRPLAEELGFKVIDKKDKVVEMDDNNIIVRVSKIPESQKEKFKVGGTFKIWEEGVKAAKNAMQVLDDTGKVLMNIVGGERIFSIKHTESLIALAKKVDRGEADEEELGKLMAKIITIQNTQEPEYVD